VGPISAPPIRITDATRRGPRLVRRRGRWRRTRKYPGRVTTNESWRKYLEAGAAVGQATAARAEDIARRLFDPDGDERESAWRDLEQLTRFGRLMGEQLAEMARAELKRQVKTLGEGSFDQVLEWIGDLLGTPATPTGTKSPEEPVVEAKVVMVTQPKDQVATKPKAKPKKKASAERGEKHKKKQQKKKEKDGKRRHASEGERVLTLAPPPGPAET